MSAAEVLASVVSALPEGEVREGQLRMCAAVAAALTRREHLLVEAGTGTGKSLAYLIPVALAAGDGERTVVATATRALQEQLVGKDLPLLTRHVERPFSAELLKGRSNYLCVARLAEHAASRDGRLAGTTADELPPGLLDDVSDWAGRTATGDRADFGRAVTEATWRLLSVDAGECPGRSRCDLSEGCFAEMARVRACAADLVVVNTALYARHLATGGNVLPPHSFVVIDEAHALEDICLSAFGVELGPGRVDRLAGVLRTVLTEGEPRRPRRAGGQDDAAGRLREHGATLAGRLDEISEEARVTWDAEPHLQDLLVTIEGVLAEIGSVLGALEPVIPEMARRVRRVAAAAAGARSDVQRILAAEPQRDVVWVEARARPVLRCVAADVGTTLAASLYARRTAVLTSATLTVAGDFAPLAWRLGLPSAGSVAGEGRGGTDAADTPAAGDPADIERPPSDPGAYSTLDVGSPFDYRNQAVLYVARHLPDPRDPVFDEAVLEETLGLVQASGGRALCLCTSRRAADALEAGLRERLSVRVMKPEQVPLGRLTAEFAADETSVLVGSLGLWQGIDVAGPSVSLVVIDKIPFARPTDPLAIARRERARQEGRDPFVVFDLPRAATLLAQGAGRLIRSRADRGVVAVLDRRLVTRPYGARLLASLPPMYRMSDPQRVRSALARLRTANDRRGRSDTEDE